MIDWNLRARLCDHCAAMAERGEEMPIAAYCAKCNPLVRGRLEDSNL